MPLFIAKMRIAEIADVCRLRCKEMLNIWTPLTLFPVKWQL
jgi:hypothetical protein